MKKVLTIAGSDSLSGGGLQADLRTFKEYNLEALNVLTCIVTVVPQTDTVSIYEVSNKKLKEQLDVCFNQQERLGAIKIGMLASLRTAKIVTEYLKEHQGTPVILDPVLALKESGLDTDISIVDFFIQELLPLATITTPNLAEAELLSGIDTIDSLEKMKLAAEKIHKMGAKNVVVKGGQRLTGKIAYDVFYNGHDFSVLEEKKLENSYNNGAGCTFASAIASGIANNTPVEASVAAAKLFVYKGIKNGIPFLPGLGNVFQGDLEKND